MAPTPEISVDLLQTDLVQACQWPQCWPSCCSLVQLMCLHCEPSESCIKATSRDVQKSSHYNITIMMHR